MPEEAKTLYGSLARTNAELLRKATGSGFTACGPEMRSFAEDCANAYATLDTAGLYDAAEDARTWALCWAVRHKEATGILHYPRLRIRPKSDTAERLREALELASQRLPTDQGSIKQVVREASSLLFCKPEIRDLLRHLVQHSRLDLYQGTAGTTGEYYWLWKFLLHTEPPADLLAELSSFVPRFDQYHLPETGGYAKNQSFWIERADYTLAAAPLKNMNATGVRYWKRAISIDFPAQQILVGSSASYFQPDEPTSDTSNSVDLTAKRLAKHKTDDYFETPAVHIYQRELKKRSVMGARDSAG